MNKNRTIKTWFLSAAMIVAFFAFTNVKAQIPGIQINFINGPDHNGINCAVNSNIIPQSPPSVAFCDGYPLVTPCPGSPWIYCFKLDNLLPTTNSDIAANGKFTIKIDPRFNITAVTTVCNLPPTTISPNEIEVKINSVIAPGTSCEVCVTVDIPINATAPFRTLYNYSGQCNGEDIFIGDILEEKITCSCDPNFKEVTPAGCGPQGVVDKNQPLTYRINFQNIGTGPAENIFILDELDNDLNVTSPRDFRSDHDISFITLFLPNSLVFGLENINLPSVLLDPIGSRGFVQFTIDPKSGLADGTQITNNADIFFDLNAPVTTNTVLNTLRDNAGGSGNISCGKNNDKVLVCFAPPGNPNNTQTLCVSPKSLPALLAQGACLGSCGTSGKYGGENIIDEEESDLQIDLYPNPIVDAVHVLYNKDVLAINAAVKISDVYGRVISETAFDKENNVLNISISDLPAGVYFVNLQNGNYREIKKIVKMK